MKIFTIISAALLVTTNAIAEEFEVGQKNKTFSVKELKMKKGDTIKFVNHDPFFHNIFSLSAVKTFDLGSYGKDESRVVVFEESGKVDVECAIHPTMQLSVQVE